MSVEKDIRDYLISTVAACTASNTFIGPFRKSSVGTINPPSIHVQEYSYAAPTPYMDAKHNLPLRNTSVHVRVRGAVNSYVTTQALAEKVWVALDRPTMTSSSSIHYVSVLPANSGVLYIGTNDLEQDEFVININVRHGSVAVV